MTLAYTASQSRVARASGISATSTLQATAGRDVAVTGSALITNSCLMDEQQVGQILENLSDLEG